MVHVPWDPVPGETPIDMSELTGEARAQVTTRKDINALEAENIRPVLVKYLSAKPSARLARFDITWSQKLHYEMFRKVWKWAGTPRTRDVNMGVPFYDILGALQGLLNDLAEWPKFKMSLLEQATRLHHRAVQIHPFPNGNGRWSRLLANIWLKRNGQSIVEWPEETIGQVSVIREQYIAAVKAADDGDYEPLIAMHEKHTRATKSQ